MRLSSLILLFGVVTGCANALRAAIENDYLDEENRLWPIPQYDGSIRLMTEKQAEREAEIISRKDVLWNVLGKRRTKISYFLYTKFNPLVFHEVDMDRPETLKRTFFNKNNPTRFMVHGWTGNLDNRQNIRVQDALFKNGEERNYNFFVVDWSVYARSLNYITARKNVAKAGIELAKFVDWLHEEGGMSFDSLTLAGHSLGAHVVGFAGKNVKKGKVSIIYGLDPGMPLFRYNNPETRLANTDANYVETIQTNGQWLGFYHPIGNVSFYPNGGKIQPGCEFDPSNVCSHGRSVLLYAESIALGDNNRFYSIHCPDFGSLIANECGSNITNIRMGDPDNFRKANGIYFLETNSNPPYGYINGIK